MTVKKKYNIGDAVWIYGISTSNVKSTQGKVIHSFALDTAGYSSDSVHYVIQIPTEIEPLLEIRTWETISQTKDGHVGSLRLAIGDPSATRKMLSRVGIRIASDDAAFDELRVGDDPSADVIHAAMEKSRMDSAYQPLVLKDAKPKRRYFTKKKV